MRLLENYIRVDFIILLTCHVEDDLCTFRLRHYFQTLFQGTVSIFIVFRQLRFWS
jgi:hypothetical protein